jgi:serine/threonine-protein kinase
MELLEGPTLEHELKRGQLPLERTVTVMRAILAALAAAHRQNLVHRDVKPQNVVLHVEDGRELPKLLDFGIAKMLDDAGDSGAVILGSAAYIAPERLRGEPYDGRADVYATGVMLHRMLTGRFPFDIALDDFENLALWHLHKAPQPTGAAPAVEKLVRLLLEKDPRKRPDASEAGALVEALVWDA